LPRNSEKGLNNLSLKQPTNYEDKKEERQRASSEREALADGVRLAALRFDSCGRGAYRDRLPADAS
jgi:hypothetical protein